MMDLTDDGPDKRNKMLTPSTVLTEVVCYWTDQHSLWSLVCGCQFRECLLSFFLGGGFKYFIYLFLEKGREGEREGEKHPCVVASHVSPLLGTWPAIQACAPTGK